MVLWPSLDLCVHFERLHPGPFNFRFTCSIRKRHTRSIATPLDSNFSVVGGVAWSQMSTVAPQRSRDQSETWTRVSSIVEFIKYASNLIFIENSICPVFPDGHIWCAKWHCCSIPYFVCSAHLFLQCIIWQLQDVDRLTAKFFCYTVCTRQWTASVNWTSSLSCWLDEVTLYLLLKTRMFSDSSLLSHYFFGHAFLFCWLRVDSLRAPRTTYSVQ